MPETKSAEHTEPTDNASVATQSPSGNAEMSREHQKFLFDCDQLIDLCSSVQRLELIDQSDTILEVRLQDLDKFYEKIQRSYETLFFSDPSANSRDYRAQGKVNLNVCSEAYYVARSHMLDMLKCAQGYNGPPPTVRHNPPLQIPTTSQLQNESYLKVPACDTDVFSGGYEDWPGFRDMFTGVYIDHPKLTRAQKLFHLRHKTAGEAGVIVRRYPVCDDNFELAWNALKTRFENKRALVEKLLDTLLDLPTITTEDSGAILEMHAAVTDCISKLKLLGVPVDSWDAMLVHLVSRKLPEETFSLWEQSLKSHRELPKWCQLDEFIMNRSEVVERIINNRASRNKLMPQQSHKSKVQTYISQENLHTPCLLCEAEHNIRVCPKFKEFSPQQRVDFIFKNKFCNNCLSHFHTKNKCKSKNTCLVCRKRHHTLLHIQTNDSQSSTTPSYTTLNAHNPSTSSQSQPSQTQSHFCSNNDTILLRTALVPIEIRGELFTIRALIDPGSQRTFLSERIRSRLQIPATNVNFDIVGIGGQNQKANKECELVVVSHKHNLKFAINAIVLPKLTKCLPFTSFQYPNCPDLSKLELADPNFNKSAQIDMILGNDSERHVNLEGIKKNICGTTSAYNTIFGWVLSGPMKAEPIQTFTTNAEPSKDTELNSLLQTFWEQEDIPCDKPVPEEHRFCEDLYTNTTIRNREGRYVVRLPFKPEFPKSVFLGSSRFNALGQYTQMEKTLSKNPELQTSYHTVLKEYLDLAHMEESSPQEITRNGNFFSYYLPHHAVVRPEHKTTKVRVVFNASRKTKSGLSLNDVLYTGPTLQTDLISTLLNWRQYKYVFSGDIQKMYRQIAIHPEDRPFQRILFQIDAQGPVRDYELKTVTFGVNCAPFLAIRTLLQLAKDVEGKYPLVSEILRNETYVDDILSGGFTIEEANAKQSQLISSLNSAGFPLKKIMANNSQLLSNISTEDVYDSDFLRFHETSTTKTLGIKWNALTDMFIYSFNSIHNYDMLTKRGVLSTVAQLFDPAGWIAPIIVRAKIFMQTLWLEGLNWDTKLSQELLSEWTLFVHDLNQIESIEIPRWIQYTPSDVVQLHGFADASKSAYCACVYIRSQTKSNVVFSNIFVAKTKVAPIQTVCLPRLELCGTLLLAKLVAYVKTTFKLIISDTVLWTDSSIVLGWLAKPPSSWETYVANRTSKIHALVPTAKWRHVPTHDNPADIGTRGCKPQELKDSFLWWKGPRWLTNPPSTWPNFTPVCHSKSESIVQTLHITCEEPDVLQRVSSYPKALRVVAVIFRFLNNSLRDKPNRKIYNTRTLSKDELIWAKTRLIVLTQEQHFSEEYKALSRSQPVNKKSTLRPLNPGLDVNKVLRVKGRLANSALPYDERNPIILPRNSRFCRLYIEHIHLFLDHAECTLMCRFIQTQFHITRMKTCVKNIIHKCKTCVIYKHKSCGQIMAPLPQERCVLTPPFHTTGIDFAGPFEVKTSHLRNAPYEKGYVCVFVCYSTKAVHLEACSNLTSSSFEAAFTRFVGRRGLPQKISSDNGRNFVGASKNLRKQFSKFLKTTANDMSRKYSVHGFEWQFIPPHAPHMGGLWEAAVKSFKYHFKRVAGAHKYTFEEFSTLLAKIEGVLNSRPISAVSEDPADITALTPGHFLRGSPLLSFPEPPSEDLSLLNRWEKLKALHHQFAIRWKEDYLRSLHKRYKWQNATPNLKVDDLVVIIDDLLPPHEWRLGRIEKTHLGSDSNVQPRQPQKIVHISMQVVYRVPLPKVLFEILNDDRRREKPNSKEIRVLHKLPGSKSYIQRVPLEEYLPKMPTFSPHPAAQTKPSENSATKKRSVTQSPQPTNITESSGATKQQAN